MDPRFEDNIPRLASALNWLCVQNYSKYLKEGLNKPTYIKQYMDDYWDLSRRIQRFQKEKMVSLMTQNILQVQMSILNLSRGLSQIMLI